jgi:hypothetical protein
LTDSYFPVGNQATSPVADVLETMHIQWKRHEAKDSAISIRLYLRSSSFT